MKITRRHISKVDPSLQATLAQARGHEMIEVLITIETEGTSIDRVLEPNNFPSSEDYYKALIIQRQNLISESLAQTHRSLKKLPLSIRNTGELLEPIVIATTKIETILNILELPKISYVKLLKIIDISLSEIRRGNKWFSNAAERFSNLYKEVLEVNTSKAFDSQKVYESSTKYINSFYNKHGFFKILKMNNPKQIDDTFVPLEFTDNFSFMTLDPSKIKENYVSKNHKAKNNNWEDIDTESYLDKTEKNGNIVDRYPHLMILGTPGSGKSTFLRQVGLESLKSNRNYFKQDCLPFLLEMKYFTSSTITIQEQITRELTSHGFPSVEMFVSNALKKGKLLILLDGLDEIPERSLSNSNLESEIEQIIKTNSSNRIIISNRTAAWKRSFKNYFKYLEIADFNQNQIKHFLSNWFVSKKQEEAKKCWETIQNYDHHSTVELAKTPLLLAFICMIYQENKDLPENRSSLYGEALDIFLKKWWNQRQIRRIDPIHRYLGIELEKNLLSEIAYNNFSEFIFSRQELQNQINNYLENNDNAPQELSGEKILEAIEIQQGLVVERFRNTDDRNQDIYSFSHLTIQEFLTSQYIVNNGKIKDCVDNHLINVQWQEVFLLISQMPNTNVDNLLLNIEAKARTYYQEKDNGKKFLVPLLSWATEVTSRNNSSTSNELDSLGKRSVAIAFCAANAYALSYADAYAGSKKSLTSAFKMSQENIPFTTDSAEFAAQNLYYHFSLAYCNSIAEVYGLSEFSENQSTSTYTKSAYKLMYAYALSKSYIKNFNNPENPSNPNPQDYINSLSEFISHATLIEETFIFNQSVNISKLKSDLENLKREVYNCKSNDEYQKFSQKIIDTWLSGFQLDSLLRDFKRKNLEEIGKSYFYPNWLMMKCKEVAINVSKQTWKGIESRMLTLKALED